MFSLHELPKQRGSLALNGWHFSVRLTRLSGPKLLEPSPSGKLLDSDIAPSSLINRAAEVLYEAQPAPTERISVALIVMPKGVKRDEEFVALAREKGFAKLPVESALSIRAYLSDEWIKRRGNVSIPIIHEPVVVNRVPKVLTISADHSVYRQPQLISTYWFGGPITYGQRSHGAFAKPPRILALQRL
jgi:hypothetical protein